MVMNDLNDMLFFAEVAERGGFSAAARALGLPKQRLSRRVAELEARLGVRLLQRTTRKLSLTAIGEQYLRHCQAVRDESQAADEIVAQARREPSGLVRLSCPVTLAQTVVGPMMPRFLARYPRVRVAMEISNRVVDVVDEGIDLALRVRPSVGDGGRLVARVLGRSRALLVASPALLQRQGRPDDPGALAGLDTVAMSGADGPAVWPLSGPEGRSHRHEHRPRYVADDLVSLKFAVVAGVGMAPLPDYLCEDELRDGTLVEVLPGWEPAAGIVHAVFASRRGMVPAVRVLLDFLAAEWANHSPDLAIDISN